MSTANTADTPATIARDRTHGLITWRLMPLLLICYLFAHLDRINIGFAKMQMSTDLNFSDTVYGFGAGLFFIAYALFGVPSNMALDRVGPRRWIATLMVVWGALSTCMFLVDSAMGFMCCAFTRGGRGGFLSGHPGVPEPLVPGRPACANHRLVRDCGADGRGDRRAALGRHPRTFS